MKANIRKHPGGQSVTAEGRYEKGRNFFSWRQRMTSREKKTKQYMLLNSKY